MAPENVSGKTENRNEPASLPGIGVFKTEPCRLRDATKPAVKGDAQDADHYVPAQGAFFLWAVAAAAFYGCYATQPWSIPGSGWNFTVQPIALWSGSVLLILALFLLLGWRYNRTWMGAFVNERNLVSASRLQAVVWTSLLLGTAVALFLLRLSNQTAAPLGFQLPDEVIGLAAVSGGSLAGAAGVSRIRKGRTPSGHEVLERGREVTHRYRKAYAKDLRGRADRILAGKPGAHVAATDVVRELTSSITSIEQQHVREAIIPPSLLAELENKSGADVLGLLDEVSRSVESQGALVPSETAQKLFDAAAIAAFKNDSHGALFANRAPCEAQWTDLIEGDELANASSLDFAKVQMLGFTLLVLGGYVTVLWQAFSGDPCAAGCPGELPAVSRGLVEVLGVSQLGYLGGKVAGPTRTT